MLENDSSLDFGSIVWVALHGGRICCRGLLGSYMCRMLCSCEFWGFFLTLFFGHSQTWLYLDLRCINLYANDILEFGWSEFSYSLAARSSFPLGIKLLNLHLLSWLGFSIGWMSCLKLWCHLCVGRNNHPVFSSPLAVFSQDTHRMNFSGLLGFIWDIDGIIGFESIRGSIPATGIAHSLKHLTSSLIGTAATFRQDVKFSCCNQNQRLERCIVSFHVNTHVYAGHINRHCKQGHG